MPKWPKRNYYLLELRCTVDESVKIDCFDKFYSASYRVLYNISTSPSIMSVCFVTASKKIYKGCLKPQATLQRFVIIHHTNTSITQKDL
jgi:hypothetical protein